jgi:hypothetical protein
MRRLQDWEVEMFAFAVWTYGWQLSVLVLLLMIWRELRALRHR